MTVQHHGSRACSMVLTSVKQSVLLLVAIQWFTQLMEVSESAWKSSWISERLTRCFNAVPDFDGLSITHGNPRQHIRAYAIGTTDFGPTTNCPCAAHPGAYYYESGAGSSFNRNTYYLSDVVWDGAGCSTGNTCCSNSNLPWFCRQLLKMI